MAFMPADKISVSTHVASAFSIGRCPWVSGIGIIGLYHSSEFKAFLAKCQPVLGFALPALTRCRLSLPGSDRS